MKRLLIDHDGNLLFQFPSNNIELDIKESVGEIPSNVSTYLLCCGAGTMYFPTHVGVVDPRSTVLAEAHAQGKDPFGMFLQALRQTGIETYITMRMNDVHNPTDADCWNTPPIRIKHPDYIVDIEAAKRNDPEWMNYCLDYSRPEVRAYFLDLIRELVDLYDVDGLQLDWMRFPRHLSGAPDEVWTKREALTAFIAEAKKIADRKNIRLAARVPTSLSGCRLLGADITEWAKQCLVKFIVASPFLTTDFSMPIPEMRAAMGGHAVPIYAALDVGHIPQIHSPESLRATATGLYDSGADGIYLFNFVGWNGRLAMTPYHWYATLHDPVRVAEKPLLFSVPHLRFRKNVDLPWQLPVTLSPGQQQVFTLRLPAAALPTKQSRLMIHSCGDVSLALNDTPVEFLPRRTCTEMFVEYVDPKGLLSEYRPAAAEIRLFRFDPQLLQPGENRLHVGNLDDKDLEIRRINLGLW